MTIELIDLIGFWKKQSYQKGPYIAHQDIEFIPKRIINTFFSYKSYIESESFGNINDNSLHLGLLPLPYVGDLSKSTIFILMLNPGLSPTDYFAEYNQPEFRNIYLGNIFQEFETEFPFHFLNPEFAWHEGFQYWHDKFKGLARVVSEKKNLTYYDSLKFLSKQISCLELMPYHSKRFGSDYFINDLQSVRLMRSFVNDFLLPKALNKNIIIIVTRKAKIWGLIENKNVVVYNKNEARSAHLTPNSKGGQAILRSLGL